VGIFEISDLMFEKEKDADREGELNRLGGAAVGAFCY